MTFDCIICRDPLVAEVSSEHPIRVDDEEGKEDMRVVATKCGHLYHKSCLSKSLEFKRRNSKENFDKICKDICPFCNADIDESKDLRTVFPIELDENLVENTDSAPGSTDYINSLQNEINRLKAVVDSQKMTIRHANIQHIEPLNSDDTS